MVISAGFSDEIRPYQLPCADFLGNRCVRIATSTFAFSPSPSVQTIDESNFV